MRQLLCILFIAVFGVKTCVAQPTNSAPSTNWGKSFSGVQMSIAVNNNAFAIGSSFVISIQITNSSTNILFMGDSRPDVDFTAFLTDQLGKAYQLTPSVFAYTRLTATGVNPDDCRVWKIGVSLNKYYDPPGWV